MNFTTDIKKEIIATVKLQGGKESKSMLSAFLKVCGTLGIKEGVPTFFFVSETESVADFMMSVFLKLFKQDLIISRAMMDNLRGRDKLILECPLSISQTALSELKLLKRDKRDFKEGISSTLLKSDLAKIAYIKGAFLGSGSCILPGGANTGYHLEIVFPERKPAIEFCKLLEEFELIAKLACRKDTFVVYIKSKEMICDFLAVIETDNALKKLTAFIEKRDEANRDNRTKNCFAGNADKSAMASVKQVLAIEKLKADANFNELNKDLQVLAKARLLHPNKTLQELADLLRISKSCLNHRMRKLMELAQRIKK